MKLKFQVNKYDNTEDFEAGLNTKFHDGWLLDSWTTDPDWAIVAVFVRDPRRKV